MKSLLKRKGPDMQAAASCPKPWVTALIKKLEKLEQRLTQVQKQWWLLLFTVTAGAYFLYVAILGVTTSPHDFTGPRPQLRKAPVHIAPPALADSIHFKKALP